MYEDAAVGVARKIQSDGNLSTDHKTRLDTFLEKRAPENGYVIYKHAEDKSDGRVYASTKGSIQSLPSDLRASIGAHLFDIDCDCSHPTNLIDCLRANNEPVPEALFRIVTERTAIRESLAEYYGTTTTNVKSLINAITYGQSVQSEKWFDENKVQLIRHHDIIYAYATATALAATTLIKVDSPDYKAAMEANPEDNQRSLTFKALSSLMERVEEQKLSCVLMRLIHEWGINPKSIVLIHDGAMCSMDNLNPKKRLVREHKSTIDEEVLRDVTCFTRKELNVFIRLSVKKGHEATSVTCGVPWPSRRSINPQAKVEETEKDERL